MILIAAGKQTNEMIAGQMETRSARVSKWPKRFAEKGTEGLRKAIRQIPLGPYNQPTERRDLANLDFPFLASGCPEGNLMPKKSLFSCEVKGL